MPEVSLIIPVYRVEKQLSRCLDSVMAQTFTDFEAILVDDGSPDQSGAICDMYAEKDDRFRVIHKQNGGVSSARNAGLDAACGTYVVFADSDDELEDNYLQCLMKGDADLVNAGVKKIEVDGTERHFLEYSDASIENLNAQNIVQMIENCSLNFIYSKRYKRIFLEKNKVRFHEDMDYAEDTLFVAEYVCHCDSIVYISETPYRYFKYDSPTLSAFNIGNIEKGRRANIRIASVLDSHFVDISKSEPWKKRFWRHYYYSIFCTLTEHDISDNDKLKILKNIFADDEFIPYSRELDYYMKDDSRLIRRLVQSRNAYLLLFAWKLIAFRTRCREKRGTSSNAKTR